jgi:hypothetical protein
MPQCGQRWFRKKTNITAKNAKKAPKPTARGIPTAAAASAGIIGMTKVHSRSARFLV